ncbi:hypothetical protein GCM10023231_11700 [Olivibacter ginsenosidimutans]|uniref:histidine kinase n=1 Tax=Olivibacter ginsenosidimutans TaxID=1176537 RepID=A0ABP9AUF3_9SPHI
MEENKLLFGVLCFAVLLAVLGIVNYKRYRDNQRHMLELANKNRKINRQYALLKKNHEQNKLLLREIHHRVKNNLQLAASLLNIQVRTTLNPDAVAALKESSSRLHAMLLVHQELYSQTQLGHVNVLNYTRNLMEYLIQSYLPTTIKVLPNIQIMETVALNTDKLTPLGLIMTELITNSLKYAKPQHNPLCISLAFSAKEKDVYTLNYDDNGQGWPETLDPTQSKSMGIRLLRDLSKQLNGRITFPQPKSSFITITFNDF